jgi:hypothetical protein
MSYLEMIGKYNGKLIAQQKDHSQKLGGNKATGLTKIQKHR